MRDPADEPSATLGTVMSPRSKASRRRDAGAVADVCPLLVSADGAWRSAYASRDHRCWAVRPPAPLNLAKQRELCLTAAHATCATFQATRPGSGEPDGGSMAPVADDASLLWPPVRSTPLVLESSRVGGGELPLVPGRAGGQALLVGLMALAFLVLVIARTTAPWPAPPASSVPSFVISASPTTRPSATPSPTAPAAPSASPDGSPAPSGTAAPTPGTPASPSPSAGRTYTVQSGDTLSGIAARFGTTVAAIADANGIADRRLIRVGQVLIIP